MISEMDLIYYTFPLILLNIMSFHSVVAQRGRSCPTVNGNKIECKPLRDCPALMSLLENRPTPEEIEYLSKAICDFLGAHPLVCCPSSTRPNPSHTHIPKPSPTKIQFSDVRFHPLLRSLLPNSCGVLQDDDKIINGDAAGLFEFPWMALLGYLTRSGFQYLCAGTLINRRYVLTAGHCLFIKNNDLVSVRLGEYDISSDLDCRATCAPPVQDRDIEEVIRHPLYSSSNAKHDIGLVRLDEDVIFNESVRPVCLPIGIEEQSDELVGQKVIVTGWGKTETGRDSSVLLKADLPIVPTDRCAELYMPHNKSVGPTQICAGYLKEGKDSCSGDSGGPLQAVSQRNRDAVYVQYGIVSYGPKNCGKAGIPGLYTRTGYYMQWILDSMRP